MTKRDTETKGVCPYRGFKDCFGSECPAYVKMLDGRKCKFVEKGARPLQVKEIKE